MMNGSGCCTAVKAMCIVSTDIALIVSTGLIANSNQELIALLAINVLCNLVAYSANRKQFEEIKKKKWVLLTDLPLILPNSVALGKTSVMFKNAADQEYVYGAFIVFTSICLASLVTAKWLLHGSGPVLGEQPSRGTQRREWI